jgi:sugar phosphate isomerase/epimerase
MRLACQERLLPGSNVLERWNVARSMGFDALELQAGSRTEVAERRIEWMNAVQHGAVVTTMCLAGGPYIGAFDADERAEAIERMKLLLEIAAELGARGVVMPAAWGLASTRLPKLHPTRTEAEDHVVLLEALHTLGLHALKHGVLILLEPLNRYEDHMVNTLQEAAKYVQAVKHESVRVMADTYHMNIEEANPLESLRRHVPWLGHVHVSDSNRFEPGKGHVDFRAILETLNNIGYDGDLALECRLSGDAKLVLPETVQFLRSMQIQAVPSGVTQS